MTKYTVPHSLPVIEPATDPIRSIAGDNLWKHINALAASTNAAISAVDATPKISQLETVAIPKALTDAKVYADTEVAKDRTRLGTLEKTTVPQVLSDAKTYAAEEVAKDRTRLGGLEKDKWFRGDIGAGGEVDSLRGTASRGRYSINSTSVTGLPGPWLGSLDIFPNSADGRTIQEFTRSGGGATVRFSRAYSGGTWSAWGPATWFAGLLGAGVDWDTLKAPAMYSIQFTNHPNQASAVIGSLEVLPSSNNVIQRFTEDPAPNYVWSRRFNGAAWSPFTRAGSNTGGGGEVATAFSTPLRGALATQQVQVASKPGSQVMSSMSKDRLRGWNSGSTAVSETRDDGATWAQLTDKDGKNPFAGSQVESVRQLDNGELLISNTRGSTGRREVWVTQNLDNPSSRTFTKTLDARAPYIKFTSSWSQSDFGSIVLLNEYGPKTPDWSGQPVSAGENARYTYLSTDYGKTWTIVFDLNDYLTNVQKRSSLDGQHLHGVAWDEYWDRIWVSYGDNLSGNGSNGIVYSDDLGATWQTAHYYSGANPPHQVVGIQPMPKCVLFYGDMGPDVVRINRTEGKGKAGGYATPTAFDSTAGGKHLCQGFTRVRRPGDDGPAIAAFSAEGAVAPPFAIATLDGYVFTEIWRDTVSSPSGMGSRSIVGPTLRGRVIIGSNDQKASGMWSEISATAPGY